MATLVLDLPVRLRSTTEDGDPVYVSNDSVYVNPGDMEIGRYYWVQVNGKPFGYRKISQDEIEAYGLAD